MAAATSPNGRSDVPRAVIVPTVTIELDGEEHELLFDFNALALAEEVTGMNVLGPGGMQGGWNATLLSASLWAAMVHSEPKLGVRERDGSYPGLQLVRSWIGLHNFARCLDAVTRAILAALPSPEQLADPNSPSASETTGA